MFLSESNFLWRNQFLTTFSGTLFRTSFVEPPKVAIFVDPEESQVKHSKSVGATAVEINTGPYADAHGSERREELRRVVQTATAATREGLDVLAGHGLTYLNVDPIVEIDEIVELNIGHSIVARAVLVGMERAVMEMVDLLRRS